MRGLWLGRGCLGPEGGRGRGRPVAWRLTWNPGLGSSYRKGSDASDHQGHTRTVSQRQGGKHSPSRSWGARARSARAPVTAGNSQTSGGEPGGRTHSHPVRGRGPPSQPTLPHNQPEGSNGRPPPARCCLSAQRQCPPLRSPGCQQREARVGHKLGGTYWARARRRCTAGSQGGLQPTSWEYGPRGWSQMNGWGSPYPCQGEGLRTLRTSGAPRGLRW